MIKITSEIKEEATQLLKDGDYENFFKLFFNVYNEVDFGDNEKGFELEMWTDGGVDMLISIQQDDAPTKFVEYVNDFDVDDTIDSYRVDSKYKKEFTIKESLKDFSVFKKWLNQIADIIKKQKCK